MIDTSSSYRFGRLFSLVAAWMFLAGFLWFFTTPAFAGGTATPLRIAAQARCHESTFHLVHAEITVNDTQTGSSKVTPFVLKLPKKTPSITLTAAGSVTLANGEHCSFHHWRVRFAGATRIVTSNLLTVDILHTHLSITAVYYRCDDPSAFPECRRSGGANVFSTAALALEQLADNFSALIDDRNVYEYQVQLFDPQGRLVLETSGRASELRIPLGESTRRLANGVYLYAVTAKAVNGLVLGYHLGKVFLLR